MGKERKIVCDSKKLYSSVEVYMVSEKRSPVLSGMKRVGMIDIFVSINGNKSK